MEPSDIAIYIVPSVSLIQRNNSPGLRTKEHEGRSNELEQAMRSEDIRNGQRMIGQRVGNERNYGG